MREFVEIDRQSAFDYLIQRRDQHLLHLGALAYDPLRGIVGLRDGASIQALALIVSHAGALPDPRPTVMATADTPALLLELAGWGRWPEPCVWAFGEHRLRVALEEQFGIAHVPERGVLFYGAEGIDGRPLLLHVDAPALERIEVRQLTEGDETLDLEPCLLSPTALRGWLRQGWRLFGAVQERSLLAHALAAYPIGDSDEVAAVYTASRVRRRKLASAVVAAVINDVRSRGRRAFYIASRTNQASQAVALGLGLRQIAETWEIPVT